MKIDCFNCIKIETNVIHFQKPVQHSIFLVKDSNDHSLPSCGFYINRIINIIVLFEEFLGMSQNDDRKKFVIPCHPQKDIWKNH